MIPFFQIDGWQIGPLFIHSWGLFVSVGIVAALLVGRRLCERYFLSKEVFIDVALAILLGAFVGARLFHVFLYEPGWYMAHPLEILAVWHGGASSVGGFVGAFLGAFIFFKRRKFSFKDSLPYIDVGAVSLWLGWGIGRIGCFLIHDHPGTLTHFIGGVQFPEGVRHDLGLYESILGFALFIVFILLFKRLVKKRAGLVAWYSFAVYDVVRFGLDFLRADDVAIADARYLRLTPAQLVILVVLLTLTCWAFKSRFLGSKRNGEVA